MLSGSDGQLVWRLEAQGDTWGHARLLSLEPGGPVRLFGTTQRFWIENGWTPSPTSSTS